MPIRIAPCNSNNNNRAKQIPMCSNEQEYTRVCIQFNIIHRKRKRVYAMWIYWWDINAHTHTHKHMKNISFQIFICRIVWILCICSLNMYGMDFIHTSFTFYDFESTITLFLYHSNLGSKRNAHHSMILFIEPVAGVNDFV